MNGTNATASAAGSGLNLLSGRVAGSALSGPDRQFEIELVSGDSVAVSLPNRLRAIPGVDEVVSVRFAADDCIVVPSEA